MTLRAILFFVLLLPTAAWSATVTVKSGDHDGFTRLVFYYPPQGKPTVEETGDSLHITFQGSEFTFDLSDAFSLISRDRVRNLRPLGNAIEVNLACDCRFNFVTISSGISYVDISHSPAHTEKDKKPSAQISGTSRSTKSNYASNILELKKLSSGFGGTLHTLSTGNPIQLSELAPELENVRKSYASEDIFFLKSTNTAPLSTPSSLKVDPRISYEDIEQKSGMGYTPAALKYITSRDNSAFKFNSAENTCIGVEHHDVLDFDMLNSDFSKTVGQTRVSLMSTDFSLNPSELNRIVKFYLSQTMFPEARFYLNLMKTGPHKDTLGFMLSVSEGNVPSAERLPADLSCIDYSNFWLFLAGLSDDFGRKELGEFLVYFRALPARLSGALLPTFLERLQIYSFPDGELFLESHRSLLPQDISTAHADILEKELSTNSELLKNPTDAGDNELSSTDRLLLEGSAHVLSSSSEGIKVRENLLRLHLHQKNWIAGIGVIEDMISDGSPGIASELLNEFLIPSLLKDASVAEVLLLSSRPIFTSIKPIIKQENLNLLEEKIDFATREFTGTPKTSAGITEENEGRDTIAEEVPSALNMDNVSGIEKHLSYLNDLLDKSYKVRNSVGEFLDAGGEKF